MSFIIHFSFPDWSSIKHSPTQKFHVQMTNIHTHAPLLKDDGIWYGYWCDDDTRYTL